MAPCHGVADRALSQRQVELTSDEQLEPVFKLLADSGEWQVLHPCRRQFDCQRQAVQLAADLSDKRGGLGDIHLLRDGRLAEHWDVVDISEFLMQVGAAPTPAGTAGSQR